MGKEEIEKITNLTTFEAEDMYVKETLRALSETGRSFGEVEAFIVRLELMAGAMKRLVKRNKKRLEDSKRFLYESD